MARLIGISGGIGSGKSVVSKVLMALGYKVYDCDSRAKSLMDQSQAMIDSIAQRISPCVIDSDGRIDRKCLSSIVFADKDKLQALNSIVHGEVRADLARWRGRHDGDALLFVESAIMVQSGLDRMVDDMWRVVAPVDIRIARVCRRNGLEPQQVRDRIDAQAAELDMRYEHVFDIVNDDVESVLLQIHSLIARAL